MRAILASATALLAAAILPGAAAQAEERCDCSATQRSAACEASVQHREGVVAVSSSTPACSMVVWTADGQPNVSLVKDGLDIFDWFGTSVPTIAVEGCEVCLDRKLGLGGADARVDVADIRPETGIDFNSQPTNAGASTAAPAGAPTDIATRGPAATPSNTNTRAAVAAVPDTCPGGSPAPELLVPAPLEYPQTMERYALDGTCEVLFDIAENGAAVNIRPTCSHDGFVREAARAVAVVRFSPPYHCGAPVVREDVTYPLVFKYSAERRPIPSMAPIPDRPGQ
ncbi:MAG: energy transducer TonB [Pseudomonadota bacterium]